jgi:flavodoxin
MNILVTYFSRSGNSERIAKKISRALNCDIEEIIDTKKWGGVKGFILGGYSALTQKETTIIEPEKDPQGYEKLVIVTPVWASNIPPAIRTYMELYKDKFNSVYFVLTYNGGGDKEVIENMKKIAGEPSAVVSFSKKEKNNNKEDFKIADCIEKIKG